MRIKTFDEATEYLDSFSYTDRSQTPGYLREVRLERMAFLLNALGNPEKSYKTIHTAGSKGKGTTSMYIAKLLQAAGYKTGLYLSPHLFDYRERFTLAGERFSDEFLILVINKLKDTVDGLTFGESLKGPGPSTFELYTAYAYLLFKEARCEWAVIETGLGGRLDATNTIESVASVLLPVELEHTALLGDTIEKIAIEKSKIIKPTDTVFISRQRKDAEKIFRAEAKAQNVPLYSINEELSAFSSKSERKGNKVIVQFRGEEPKAFTLKSIGRVYAEDAALALLVSRKLGFYKGAVSLKALEGASLPGRFSLCHYKDSEVVLDVAHTGESVKSTVSAFKSIFKRKRERAVIFGAIEGKDVEAMLKQLLEAFEWIIISKPGDYKRSDIEGIYKYAVEHKENQRISLIPEAKQALEIASLQAKKILITGSFYLAAEYKEVFDGKFE